MKTVLKMIVLLLSQEVYYRDITCLGLKKTFFSQSSRQLSFEFNQKFDNVTMTIAISFAKYSFM